MIHFKNAFFAMLALLLVIAPMAANAEDNVGVTRNCLDTIDGAKIQAIAVYQGHGSYQSHVIVNGTEVQPLACVSSTRPSTVFTRCSFKIGDSRFEFYPIATTTSGKQKFMQYVVWHGDHPLYGSFANCAN